ncbi:MAG: UDP-N-acetylmuramoyl-tripeptide--D-alanyl-D-alanine ligase [Candidatus Zixiibacteriota bacterium]
MAFDRLATMTGGRLLTAASHDRKFTGVSSDSRTIEPGQLFFAIKGEKHDGHEHIDQAVSRGAAGLIVRRGFFADRAMPATTAVVEVADTHEAMLKLAAEYMKTLPAKRVGITGSNGKTTTKEFTYRLLSAVEENIYRSPGNFNNLYGIPLALFAMPNNTSMAILEMGISVPGEMNRLASLVRPHLMAVTNVGPTHLEFLGSVEAVAREKLRAVHHCEPGAPLIVNADDPVLMAEARRVHSRPITFGILNDADFRPLKIRETKYATYVAIDYQEFRLPLFGQYQVYNLLCAYAIARVMGAFFDEIDTTTIKLTTPSMRGEVVASQGITFISDCYNANPESVSAGLKSFHLRQHTGRKVVVLGDMLELGEPTVEYHRDIGKQLADYDFDLILAVGPMSRYTIESARGSGVTAVRLRYFDDARSCALASVELLRPGDLVYLKGSRGIGLEAVLKEFVKSEGDA